MIKHTLSVVGDHDAIARVGDALSVAVVLNFVVFKAVAA